MNRYNCSNCGMYKFLAIAFDIHVMNDDCPKNNECDKWIDKTFKEIKRDLK